MSSKLNYLKRYIISEKGSCSRDKGKVNRKTGGKKLKSQVVPQNALVIRDEEEIQDEKEKERKRLLKNAKKILFLNKLGDSKGAEKEDNVDSVELVVDDEEIQRYIEEEEDFLNDSENHPVIVDIKTGGNLNLSSNVRSHILRYIGNDREQEEEPTNVGGDKEGKKFEAGEENAPKGCGSAKKSREVRAPFAQKSTSGGQNAGLDLSKKSSRQIPKSNLDSSCARLRSSDDMADRRSFQRSEEENDKCGFSCGGFGLLKGEANFGIENSNKTYLSNGDHGDHGGHGDHEDDEDDDLSPPRNTAAPGAGGCEISRSKRSGHADDDYSRLSSSSEAHRRRRRGGGQAAAKSFERFPSSPPDFVENLNRPLSSFPQNYPKAVNEEQDRSAHQLKSSKKSSKPEENPHRILKSEYTHGSSNTEKNAATHSHKSTGIKQEAVKLSSAQGLQENPKSSFPRSGDLQIEKHSTHFSEKTKILTHTSTNHMETSQYLTHKNLPKNFSHQDYADQSNLRMKEEQEEKNTLEKKIEEKENAFKKESGKKSLVYRNKEGVVITEEEWIGLQADKKKLFKKKFDKNDPGKELFWSRGLEQIREMKQLAIEEEKLSNLPFSRYDIEEDFDKELKDRIRWNDPLTNFDKKYISSSKSASCSNSSIYRKPAHLVCKFASPPNRYNILAGYRWDGVVRGNGYEEKLMKEMNKRKYKLENSYKCAIEDM